MKRKKDNIVYYIDVLFIMLILLFFAIKYQNINIYLVGNHNITIVVNNEYQDELFMIVDNSKNIDISKSNYEITTDLDTNRLGTYSYKYFIKYKGKLFILERTIEVVDSIPPVIEVDEALVNKNVCKENYDGNEATALDNYDGDITDKIIKEVTDYGIKFSVSDSSNNVTEEIIKVEFKDKKKPVIKLKGSSTEYVIKNEEYKELGYSVTDNCDGDITNKVVVNGEVDTSKEGTYTLTYTISDVSGNKTSTTRKVIVSTKKEYEINKKKQEIENYITNNKYNVSVLYYDINSGYEYGYNDSKAFFGASLIKTLAAIYAYEKIDLTDDIKALVKPMISVSDNNAYSKLVKKIGIKNLKKYGLSLGATYVNNLSDERYYVNTTAKEQLIFWKKLWNVINNNKNGNELKSYFINDTARYLDFDGLPEVMHKYGLANGYFNDVGIVLDDHPYIIIILTKEANKSYGKIINNISQKVYELHKLVIKK